MLNSDIILTPDDEHACISYKTPTVKPLNSGEVDLALWVV